MINFDFSNSLKEKKKKKINIFHHVIFTRLHFLIVLKRMRTYVDENKITRIAKIRKYILLFYYISFLLYTQYFVYLFICIFCFLFLYLFMHCYSPIIIFLKKDLKLHPKLSSINLKL